MMARMKHVGPEESLAKPSQLQRFESDALTDKISKPILSLSVERKHQIGRSKCFRARIQPKKNARASTSNQPVPRHLPEAV